MIGSINRLKHLAPLVPSVLLEILQQVSSGYLTSLSSSVLRWPFWGIWRWYPTTWNVWHWPLSVPGILLVSSGYLSSLSSSVLRWPFWGVWQGYPTTSNVCHWPFGVPGIMLEILQQVSSGYYSSWSSSILGVTFWGLAGVSHHLKHLALVICYSWYCAGHLATGYKL